MKASPDRLGARGLKGDVMEINFENVNPSDEIRIRTRNSLYKFAIVEPGERRGILTGGSLGDRRREAVLVSSIEGDESGEEESYTVLKTGARALFFMPASNGFERLITSVIIDVSHQDKEGEKRRAA
jgi:hypothetical protein